jgi:hypothetical protein
METRGRSKALMRRRRKVRRTEKIRNERKSSRRMLTGHISSPYLQICEGHLEQSGFLFTSLMI